MATGDDGLSPIPILHLEASGVSAEIRFAPLQGDGSMIVGVNDDKLPVRLIPLENDRFTAIVGARRETVRLRQQDQTIFVHDIRASTPCRRFPTSAILAPSQRRVASCAHR